MEGERDLQVPAGTQPDDVLLLPKLGAPKLNKPSQRGDHFFSVKVTIPKELRYRSVDYVAGMFCLTCTRLPYNHSKAFLKFSMLHKLFSVSLLFLETMYHCSHVS